MGHSLKYISKKLDIPEEELQPKLDALAKKALVIKTGKGRKVNYSLAENQMSMFRNPFWSGRDEEWIIPYERNFRWLQQGLQLHYRCECHYIYHRHYTVYARPRSCKRVCYHTYDWYCMFILLSGIHYEGDHHLDD